eukprot:9096472-Pyramimonas_sp.AAC.1
MYSLLRNKNEEPLRVRRNSQGSDGNPGNPQGSKRIVRFQGPSGNPGKTPNAEAFLAPGAGGGGGGGEEGGD